MANVNILFIIARSVLLADSQDMTVSPPSNWISGGVARHPPCSAPMTISAKV